MMSFVIILLLTGLQFLLGFGLLGVIGVRQKPAITITVSILLGIAVFSFVPFLLELLRVPLTAAAIFISLFALCSILLFFSRKTVAPFFQAVRKQRWRLQLYELPFLMLIAFMVFVSAWRCVYFPPTSRDLTSGPEVIAEYAVREKTMINSVFTVDLETTNNQFKPPFLTGLQIVYKYAGFPFGQVWLPVVFICFLIFLYHVLSRHLHKAIAGLLLVLFIAIPEMYAYTVMVLFDYSNTVFFCLSVFFLFEFFRHNRFAELVLAGVLMGVATYIRSETLILAGLLALAIPIHFRKRPQFLWDSVKGGSYFILPALIIYLLSITVYINLYLPTEYKVGELLNKRVYNPALFINRVVDMSGMLFNTTPNYFGYFAHFFGFVFVLNPFCKKPWTKTSLRWLFAVLAVYFGIALIGFLFPLYDLTNTTKRGLFKVFPLMLLFMGSSRLLISLSERLWQWERGSTNTITQETNLTKG